MLPIRALSSRTAALRTSALRNQSIRQPQLIRPLSQSHIRLGGGGHGHESPYDAPGGWLFGRDPSIKHEKEPWENIFIYGFFGCLAFLVVGYCYKPDTSIQTWALEEARRRLEYEGILTDSQPGAFRSAMDDIKSRVQGGKLLASDAAEEIKNLAEEEKEKFKKLLEDSGLKKSS